MPVNTPTPTDPTFEESAAASIENAETAITLADGDNNVTTGQLEGFLENLNHVRSLVKDLINQRNQDRDRD